jgi:uroporphyrinogen decarboxylase
MRKPDFERNTLRALTGGVPGRASLFELFLNGDFYLRLAGWDKLPADETEYLKLVVEAMARAGYDYATTHASQFHFELLSHERRNTISLNDAPMITDWASFERYHWNDPADFDCGKLERARAFLPEGMKLMVMGPGGVLENTISLTGYDNLCVMLYEEPELVREITTRVGEALVKYYALVAEIDTVGFLCSNDDWGFNTQTFLSPGDMRKYIFGWHEKIVRIAHRAGKPCILHSCGYFDEVMDDIVHHMKFDARHSYEDNICPVEEAYERLNGRIAVLGGIDMHFMVSETPERIFARATAMLERSRTRGGYLLGTGNSVPEYIPFENYKALLRAAEEFR